MLRLLKKSITLDGDGQYQNDEGESLIGKIICVMVKYGAISSFFVQLTAQLPNIGGIFFAMPDPTSGVVYQVRRTSLDAAGTQIATEFEQHGLNRHYIRYSVSGGANESMEFYILINQDVRIPTT